MAENKGWRDYLKSVSTEKETDSKETGTWRDLLSVKATKSEQTSGGWRDKLKSATTGVVANEVSNRVNSWLQNYNGYISDYQKRNSGRKYSYEDSYVSDSGEWLEKAKKQKSAYDTEADEILSYIDQYKGYLDTDWVKEIKSTLAGARSNQNKILEAYAKDNEWWNSFGSEDLVKEYGSAEEAYKYYQMDDNLRKTYTGMSSTELSDILNNMEDGKEKDWLTDYKSTVVYDERSKADLDAMAKEIEDMENLYNEAFTVGFWHNEYEAGLTPYDRKRMETYNRLHDEYGGDIHNLEKAISQKKQEMTLASRVQEGIKLSGVADETSEFYDPEFKQYSGYTGSTWIDGGFDRFFSWDDSAGMKTGYEDIRYDYINNPDAVTETLSKSANNADLHLLSGLQPYQHMTDDQISTYNYYYAKHGKEAADHYLDNIQDSLNAAQGQKMSKQIENKWVLQQLFGIAAGLDQSHSGLKSFFSNEDYIPTSATQYASGYVRENLGENGGAFSQGVYDLITTTANMAPSILVSTAIGALNPMAGAASGNALMGVSAAGNAYSDAINRGFDKNQARTYSTLIGGSEVALGAALGGISKLGGISSKLAKAVAGIDRGLARWAIQYGGKIASESLEEGLQEILDPLFQNAILHADENVDWSEVAYSALLGGLSAGALESIGTVKQVGTEQRLKKAYDGKTDSIINEGLASDIDTESYQLATEYKEKTASGKTLTGAEIRNLLEANQEQITPKDLKLIKSATEKRLTELGETGNVAQIAELATKRATGQKLSKAETSILAHSQYGAQVAKELLPENIEANNAAKEWAKANNGEEVDDFSNWAENIGTRKVNFEAYNKDKIKAREALNEMVRKATEDPNAYKPLESRVEAENDVQVSDTGKSVIRGTDQEIDLSNPTFKKISENGAVLIVDGKEVDANNIDYSNADLGYAIKAVGKIENITPAAAGAVVGLVDKAKPVVAQMNGLDEAFTYGYYNYSEADLKAGNFTGNLSQVQLNDAYKLGQYVRSQTDMDADAPVVKMRTEADAKLTEEQKTAQQKAQIESNDVEVYFEDGGKTVKFDEHSGKYDKKRMAAVNTAKFLAKLKIGGKYYFFESYVNEDGDRVYKDADGNEVEAPNGIYKDSDGSIHIDLNAGDDGSGIALYTLSHELTHFVKAQSKKQFKILADLVTEAFDKTDLSMRERVLEKQKFLEDKRGEKVSYDEAYEEVVADAMSTMLTDGTFHEKLMEIKVKDKGLFNTIKRFFDKMIAKFRKEYENLTPDQRDSQDIRAMKDMFDKIQTAFAEALVEASDNFHATDGQKNTTEVGGEKMMVRSNVVDVNGKVYSKVVKPGLTVYDKVKHSKKSYVNYLHTKIFKRTFNLSSNDSSSIVVEFAKQNERVKKDGDKTPRRALGELEATEDRLKMIAIINIRDLLKNSEPLEPSSENSHQWLDAGGWRDRISYMEDHNDVYPVILHIPKTRDGRYLLYDVSVIKDEGSTVDIDATALASSSDGRASDTKEDGVRSAVKSIEPSREKITQPDSKVKNESVEAMDVEVDAKTESVAPAVLKSERTWTASDYVQERNKAAKEIAKAIGVTEQKAKDYIDSINSIAKMIAEDRSRLDYFSSPGRSSFVDNAEYGGSFDFSTLCKKRKLLTGTFTAIQKALPNTALTADEILDIRNRMKEADLEVSCGLCYVEGSRANMGQFSKEFLRLYKQYYPDAWQPNMVDVNTPDGVEWMRINHPEAYEQYEYFWNHYGTLKEGDKNLFASQQKPKLYQLHTEYNGEILNKFKNDDKVEDKNLNGGIRLQSFSDFEIVHLIDTMQIIMDMSRVGLAGQAYTKVPDFAWALGDTGLKINLSLIAKGVDENGNLIFDDVEGMPIAEAMKLRDRYSKNVGTILVAFNDQQLLAAMADERVDFIIPFHRSQWKKSQYEAMGLPAKTKDYTFMQNEKYIKPQFHEFRGRLVKDKATNYMPNEYWDFSKSGKENAEAYLEMCARNNKRPKFYKLLQNNGDGSYYLKADGSTDGYWKLLIDFKMYDNDGNGSPQMAVKPDFNMGEAQRMLNDYSGGHSNFPVAQGIVDDFVKDYKNSHKGQKYSERGAANRAKEYFGTTTDFAEAGFILPSGEMLRFTDDKHRGERQYDHRAIGIAYGVDVDLSVNHGFNKESGKFLDEFVENGGIRFDAGEPSLNMDIGLQLSSTNPLTKAQEQVIRDFVEWKVAREIQFESQMTEEDFLYRGPLAIRIDFGGDSNYAVGAVSAKDLSAWGKKSLEYEGGNINANRIIADIRHYYKTGETRKPSLVAQFRYSERGEGSSNRSLLANAFEGISQNSVEYKMLQDYKGHIKELNKLDAKLSDLNAEIRKIRFGTEGARDMARLTELENEAKEVAKEINRYDKRLLSLEASEPLRKVIDRERKKENQKVREHVQEIQQNKKMRAEQTELRHKIRKTVRDLDKLLNRGNKKLNVKEDMKGFASKALELADYLFTDHISNDELIRNGITVRMTPKEAALVKETEDILTKLYDQADSLTDEEFKRLDEKRKANEYKLRDLLTAQRNERLNTPVYNLFNDLVTEYAKLKNSGQEAVKAAYNADVERFLRSYIGEANGETDSGRKTLLQNMRVADMTTDELWKLSNAYEMVLHSIRQANTLFVKGKAETLEQKVGRIAKDFESRKIPEGKVATIARNLSNKMGWDYEKLYYALDRIGSEAFTELVMNIADSENTVMRDVMEAAAFRDEMVKKYDYNNWNVNKEIDREFLDSTGKKFKLTLGQMMALYAYSRRDGAWDHIEYGGFVFGEAALTNPRPADSYKLSKDQCMAITDLLTKEQKVYAEDMQKFLSETMGEKGNEVSMLLYGIKMFGEKNYFPIHIAGQFKAQAQESQAKAAAGFSSMTNAGFTHAQNPNAKAPFVLEGFNEIWVDHVNEMSRYHGTVPALEDMRRVMNYSHYSEATADSIALKQMMENSFGKDAVDYFDNLYREANSGAITDKLQKWPKKLLSLFRKNSVAYSLSVLVQQPASLVRAYAMVDRKYFGVKGFGTITSGVVKAVSDKWTKAHTNAYNEMLKYAPGVTMAKEIGGFDTATGGSIRSYLLDTNKSLKQTLKTGNAKEVIGGLANVVDDNAIANLPNVADKIAWIEIWNACKRETVAKHKDLATNSEEFMKLVGERFTEVIRATQVYDSIFAKSPLLKSKNLAVQYLVSFMNEPNTVANMVEKAVRDTANGNWKSGVRTAVVVMHSIIFTNVLKSIVYAMRDDDEDETYIEKYLEAIAGNMTSDFNPLNYIPIARDVWSLAQGYDVERADMAIVADAIDALGKVVKNAFTETDDMTEEQLIAFDKKVTDANWKLVESMASFFGIPVKNIRREIEGVLNTAKNTAANHGLTTKKSAWDKVYDSVVDSIPFMSSKAKNKQDKLYDVILSGDKAYLERLKVTYKDEDAYHTAVRKALRENDPRIREAAQAQINGNPSERVRIAKLIIADGFIQDDVVMAINAEINAMTSDNSSSSAKKAKGFYTVEDFITEAVNGDRTAANAIKDDVLQTAQKNGKSLEEAEKDFISDVKSNTKKAYLAGSLNDAVAEKILLDYTDMDSEEVSAKVSYWTFSKANPDYDLNEAQVNKLHEFAEPAEIPLDVFVQYVEGTKGLETKYDEWGDVEVSKRDQVLAVIDSLDLTWQQKDALYLAHGYAESEIWNVPW